MAIKKNNLSLFYLAGKSLRIRYVCYNRNKRKKKWGKYCYVFKLYVQLY